LLHVVGGPGVDFQCLPRRPEDDGWENGALCKFETRFDPAKVDEEKLRNTIEVIFGEGFYRLPPGGGLSSSPVDHQQACEREKERVVNLPVLDLPGIEDYRKRRLDEFEDVCRFEVLESRAAKGDPAALREFTPSVVKCSLFIDALEGKTDIRTVWRDVVETTCRKNSRPDECRINSFAVERRPDAEAAIRREVLYFGWTSCSVPYLKTSDLDSGELMRAFVEKSFRRRFKIKAFPCSD